MSLFIREGYAARNPLGPAGFANNQLPDKSRLMALLIPALLKLPGVSRPAMLSPRALMSFIWMPGSSG